MHCHGVFDVLHIGHIKHFNSAKKNGDILNLVPELYEAWHAGVSRWKKLKSLNRHSIGIEIQNGLTNT